jgi:hypothetical protein
MRFFCGLYCSDPEIPDLKMLTRSRTTTLELVAKPGILGSDF